MISMIISRVISFTITHLAKILINTKSNSHLKMGVLNHLMEYKPHNVLIYPNKLKLMSYLQFYQKRFAYILRDKQNDITKLKHYEICANRYSLT